MIWSLSISQSLLVFLCLAQFAISTKRGLESVNISTPALTPSENEIPEGTDSRTLFNHTNATPEEWMPPSSACRVNLRREWRAIDPYQRFQYLEAVRCLQALNSTVPIPGARTRFDDFQGHHINLTTRVHSVGQFLPWHRWFIHAYSTALQKECNYNGPIPYWDWTIDTDPSNLDLLRSSPIFDAHGGFGNLPLVRAPVSSGVFAGYLLPFGTGPPPNITSHPLERGFDPTMLQHLTAGAVKNTLNNTSFETFRIELEGRPVTPLPKIHDSGHRAVGGDMGDTWSSPGEFFDTPLDPLFYLHHANLDRLWWKWQSMDFKNRLYQISGRSTQDPPYVNVTLNDTLPTEPIGRPVQIYEVMDIRNSFLCYSYA
ncbi:hypothetical protein H0H92_007732 [Tricholoma furcatifolium]|nr:hypothetical protein H0H92_007732 [Tricholoma furcatifolium]